MPIIGSTLRSLRKEAQKLNVPKPTSENAT